MCKNNESGRTMIEVILVLSIFSVLAVGVMKMTNTVLDKFRISRIGSQITDLSKAVSARYMSVGRYDNIDINRLGVEKVIPQDMVQTNGVLTHAFGGRVDLTGNKNTFEVKFSSLNQNTCFELALLNWNINDTTNLVSLSINDDKYIWTDRAMTSRTSIPLPVTVDNALISCKNNNNNVIVWEFE